MSILSMPGVLLRFWFYEMPLSLGAFFLSLNKAALQILSLPLLLKTFFQPWKHEYRAGLVGFSRAMGMTIKTCVIFADSLIMLILLIAELIIFFGLLLLPIFSIAVLFYA